MAYGIGLRVDEHSLSLAVIELTAEKLMVHDYRQVAHRETQQLAESLAEMRERYPAAYATAVLGISASHCLVRKFNVRFTEETKIAQIAHYEAEQYIHSHAIDDLITAYHILGQNQDKTRLLVVAMPKSAIARTLHLVEDHGCYPAVIDMDIMGMVHLIHWCQNTEPYSRLLLLDVHDNGFNLALLQEGKIRELRSTRLQLRSLFDGLTLETDDTMELDLDAPDSDSRPVGQTERRQFYERLLRELQRTLFNKHQVDRIYLSGPGELVDELGDFLHQALHLPVDLWYSAFPDQLAFAETIITKWQTEAATVVGLALRSAGVAEVRFDFRQEQFVYARAFDTIKRPLAWMLAMLALCLLVGALYLEIQCRERAAQYDKLVQRAEKIYQRRYPGDSLRQVNYRRRIYRLRERLVDGEAHHTRIPSLRNAFEYWQRLFHELAVARQRYLFTVDSFAIGQKEIIFEGKMDSDLVLDEFTRLLGKAKWVDSQPNSLRPVFSQPIADPENPKLPRRYRYRIGFANNNSD